VAQQTEPVSAYLPRSPPATKLVKTVTGREKRCCEAAIHENQFCARISITKFRFLGPATTMVDNPI
jgi:hypothetical protein